MEINQWPPLTECPQYKYGMLQPYLGRLELEDERELDDSYYYSSDDDERAAKPHEIAKKFLKQVRQSRGYDVDCVPPSRLGSPFRPVEISIELEDKEFRDEVMKATHFAIKKINEATGKIYKLEELQKVVETRNFMLLLTFTAKEVVAGADPDVDNDARSASNVFQAMVSVPLFEDLELEEWMFKPHSVAPEGEGA